jgi:glycerol-3-phosphate dehydrogenase
MNRNEMLARVSKENFWDIVIIGGGATGVGCAVDAASRGYKTLLLEQNDFGKGTSSRSTKLVHGGVRYLEQGNVSLVFDALKERGILLKNAPHLVKNLSLIVPNFSWFEKFYYGVGLKVYDALAGKYSFGKSQILSKDETLNLLPTIDTEKLAGGILYHDGQFDDTRLLINLVQTAVQSDAVCLNYARVFELNKDAQNKVNGLSFIDEESGQLFSAKAKVVINATGAFCDKIRQFFDANAEKIIKPSQGIHLVFDKSFLPSETGILIPKTVDGRVLFAIPWHEHTLIGTTDTPIETAELEPKPFAEEIEFVLETAGKYLSKKPKREDILSVFVGIRPLVKPANAAKTSAISRDHTIEIDDSNLLTIAGGKWTTYRKMAEDAINQATKIANLEKKICQTKDLQIYQTPKNSGEKLDENLPYTVEDVREAVRNEMARTLEDVLARRTRSLFLNAKVAVRIAPKVVKIMAQELGKDETWQAEQVQLFQQLAENYIV